jgi:uncharacterized protein
VDQRGSGPPIPIAYIPFLDRDAALNELVRCKEAGQRAFMMTQNPAVFGAPGLANPHWDPVWAAAEEMGMPVDFHIGSGDNSLHENLGRSLSPHAAYGSIAVATFLANAHTISTLIFGGVCHRFPSLNFVSVESGIGWLKFVSEAMDWQWLGAGVHKEHPEYELLPSEYFKRQVYGCFWFEQESARWAISHFEDNVLYESDFPHPTSMSPGPASPAVAPREYIRNELSDLPELTLRKVLHNNAACIYHLKQRRAR